MNDSLYIAATGMHMQQKGVDTISNNLANVNTPGFKKGRVSFEDLVYRDLAGATAAIDSGSGAQRLWQGSGVGMASIFKSFIAGELKKTDAPMDLAIRGDGFIEVVTADGAPAFTRGGTLTVDKDGFLATSGGQVLKPSIHVGNDVRGIVIEEDGRVMVRAGSGQPFEAGRLEMVRFSDTAGLTALGANLYKATERSGDPIYGRAGEDGVGSFAQGFVEGSNVNLVEEMVDLMVAQRAYESSVKVLQASDEMLAMSNNLRK